MAVLSELRYSLTRFGKIFSVLLALVLFAFVSAARFPDFSLYQILRPARNPASFDLSVMMGHPDDVSVSLARRRLTRGLVLPRIARRPCDRCLPRLPVAARGCAHAGDGASGSPIQRLPIRLRRARHEPGNAQRSAMSETAELRVGRRGAGHAAMTSTSSISGSGAWTWAGTPRSK